MSGGSSRVQFLSGTREPKLFSSRSKLFPLGSKLFPLGFKLFSSGSERSHSEFQPFPTGPKMFPSRSKLFYFNTQTFPLRSTSLYPKKKVRKNRELRGLCLLSNASKTYLLPESAWQVIVKNRTEIRTRRQGDAQINGERRVNITNLIFVLQRETMISLP